MDLNMNYMGIIAGLNDINSYNICNWPWATSGKLLPSIRWTNKHSWWSRPYSHQPYTCSDDCISGVGPILTSPTLGRMIVLVESALFSPALHLVGWLY